MKLEDLERALEDHLAAVRNSHSNQGAATPSLEDARYAAYREMTIEAWETYRELRLNQTESDFIDEVLQSNLPGAAKTHLIGREDHNKQAK